MESFKNNIHLAKNSIQARFEGHIDQAVILGSGLSGLELDGFSTLSSIKYADIEGLPKSTAPSHTGVLEIVSNGHSTIALCSGRQHLYEGYSAQEVCSLVYTLNTLGTHHLILTNASGSLNPDFLPGEVMLIKDHINFTGQNPLIGQDDTFGIRFPDMSQAYNLKLGQLAIDAAKEKGLSLHQGVYAGVSGPSLETSAERRMLRILGGDAVGMSTVLEVLAANHCGMKVLGLSAICNMALGDENQQLDTIEQVLANAAIAGTKIKIILELILSRKRQTKKTPKPRRHQSLFVHPNVNHLTVSQTSSSYL